MYSGLFRGRGLIALACLLATSFALRVAPARAAVGPSTVSVAAGVAESTPTACSLRAAIQYANATSGAPTPGTNDCAAGAYPAGAVTINVPANTAHYTLAAGALNITGAEGITISGAGQTSTFIDGGGTSTVLNIGSTANVTLTNLEVTGGVSGNDGASLAYNGLPGGGISNAGNLTLNSVTVTGNTTSSGQDNTGGGTNLALGACASTSCRGGNGGNGGGIYSVSGSTLTINSSTITGNTTGSGGTGAFPGTYTDGTSEEFGGDGGTGGYGAGIYENGATVTITNSTISANTTGPGGNATYGSHNTGAGGPGGPGGYGGSGGNGAAIYATGGTTGKLTISGSTIADNTTGAGGGAGAGGCCNVSGPGGYGGNGGIAGGIFAFQASALTNDTIVGNQTGAGGPISSIVSGGLGAGVGTPGSFGGWYQGARPGNASSVTVARNSAGASDGGIYASAAITLTNSIIASNAASSNGNCGGGLISDNGNNVYFGDQTGCPTGGSNESTADPKLAALLADNGGPTPTLAILGGSSAIDHVPSNDCPQTSDQRGVSRPQGSACDAGAYEFAPPIVSSPGASANGQTGGTVSATITPNLSSQDTSVVVKYGTSTSYGSVTSAQTVTRTAGSPKSLSFGLTGLNPSTTYHAQIVATNGDGTTTSADVTFTTAAASTAGQNPAGPSATGPSATVVRAALAQALHVSGKAGKLEAILKAGGYRVTFSAPSAGKLVIRWNSVPKGARASTAAAAASKPKAVLVAKATVAFRKAGKATVTVKLTRAGRTLLAHARRLKLTAIASFAPVGGSTITSRRALVLRR